MPEAVRVQGVQNSEQRSKDDFNRSRERRGRFCPLGRVAIHTARGGGDFH